MQPGVPHRRDEEELPAELTVIPEPMLPFDEPEIGPSAALRRLRPWIQQPTLYGSCLVYREESPYPAAVCVPNLPELLGDERLCGFDPDKALYLDIEATGLSHGAGTFAFLIGLAYVEDGKVVLEQLFMPDPSDEVPVLGRFLELVERFPYLVSFNGKSYDLSVLQSRLVVTRLMSRVEVDLKVRPHLDLLHVSRQAYKGVYENSKLQTLEREVLRIDPAERANDVPGSMVPALYFHYLTTGYAPHLDPVLAHNRTDVLSMVTLTRHLLDLLREPHRLACGPTVLHNLGRSALRKKLNARAASLLAAAAESEQLPEPLRHRTLVDLVTACRRGGDIEGAAEAVRSALSHLGGRDPTEHDRLQRQLHRFERTLIKLARVA
ncbi:MAG: hypothetical protein ACI9WU_001005 [Myxococcota bacterium]|jgi:uncharacterized protein YprB with RNaseH-like and TPR domain